MVKNIYKYIFKITTLSELFKFKNDAVISSFKTSFVHCKLQHV